MQKHWIIKKVEKDNSDASLSPETVISLKMVLYICILPNQDIKVLEF